MRMITGVAALALLTAGCGAGDNGRYVIVSPDRYPPILTDSKTGATWVYLDSEWKPIRTSALGVDEITPEEGVKYGIPLPSADDGKPTK